MGDRSPPTKPDEQYPLLKVEGSGEIGHAMPSATHAAVALDWGVTCKKSSKFSRWPGKSHTPGMSYLSSKGCVVEIAFSDETAFGPFSYLFYYDCDFISVVSINSY